MRPIHRCIQLFLLTFFFLNSACSFQNHNPGENQADADWQQGRYTQALEIIVPAAEQGFPWAQLRLGIAYEYGQGKEANYAIALQWYSKVAIRHQDNAWADGTPVGLGGAPGYYNVNQDARMAQYLMARILFNGDDSVEINYPQAWLWANYVVTHGSGKDLIYCCEQSRRTKQSVKLSRVNELLTSIEALLTIDELENLQRLESNWKPSRAGYL